MFIEWWYTTTSCFMVAWTCFGRWYISSPTRWYRAQCVAFEKYFTQGFVNGMCLYLYFFFLYLEIRFYNFILFFLYNFTPTVIYVYVSKEHMCVIVFLIDMSVCLGLYVCVISLNLTNHYNNAIRISKLPSGQQTDI